ncbi:DUF6197 family protein [Streptomyces hydrogenans]|uniref:Uncharacterized protein n=1 Tax=Streptomyces hydrogenans TaxID=1873719 RepID=A0ABQ3PJG6_9ACTN|nr:hypothetical protein [Streptomyces hydrogenans]GHG10298.1 hypothetical protein GCM10018784_23800 [Streptomyces hydrogenans]GHI25169.1 hypothetical protein Shyd_65400 [Streptomyces hydrogenans]
MTPEEIDSQARQALLDAAEVIGRDGWHQGAYYSGHTYGPEADGTEAALHAPVCAIGSIRRALWGEACVPLRIWGSPQVRVALHAEKLLGDHVGACVPDWNDKRERTAEDVILAMKQTAHGE